MFRFDFFVTALSARIFDVSNTWNICDWKLFNNKNVLKVIGREIILAILGCCFLLFWAKQEMLFKSCGINKKNCDIWPFIYDVHKKTDQTFTPPTPTIHVRPKSEDLSIILWMLDVHIVAFATLSPPPNPPQPKKFCASIAFWCPFLLSLPYIRRHFKFYWDKRSEGRNFVDFTYSVILSPQ